MSFLAGQGAGRIDDLKPAGQIVHDLIAEAEHILRTLGRQTQVKKPAPTA
jgi:hypothetical protein